MRPKVSIGSPIQLFLLLLGEETLLSIVDATNAYATSVTQAAVEFRRPRPWHPLTRNELIVWLGSLFWMGRHYEHNREYYWNDNISHFGQQVMSKTRWEQIHRFLKINNAERQEGQLWWYKVDPMLTTVRQNIQNAVYPASWLAVDELMIPFQGRTKHSIKIRGKPIKEGFKMWCLGFKGYIWTFRFHSGHEDDEGILPSRTAPQIDPLPSVKLAPTHQVPLVLCEEVRLYSPEQSFLVFLDNLFLNVNIAHCLLAIGFSVMGTTRKNAAGLPKSLTDVKDKDKKAKKEEKKQPLAYNSVLAIIVDFCLCFLWQDNSSVLAISTAHSLHRQEDRIERQRKRPKLTSTNATQAYSYFEGQSKKWLKVPIPIDDYNHGMNGVDTASQIRGGFSVHRPTEVKWWRPILYWILDICANNAYLIWKTIQDQTDHELHKQFIDSLIEDMTHYDAWTPAPPPTSEHHWEQRETRGRCAWGRKTPGGCVQGDKKERQVLGEVSSNARSAARPRQVQTGCKQCGVFLCIDRKCWRRFHANR